MAVLIDASILIEAERGRLDLKQYVAQRQRVMGLDLNLDMVATTRALTASTDVPITWQEGRADALPCAEASFDVVLCQQGRQFFPDRLTALRTSMRTGGFRDSC